MSYRNTPPGDQFATIMTRLPGLPLYQQALSLPFNLPG
jgi:hypothetical protein